MGKVVCLLNIEALVVFLLGGSVLNFDLARAVKKKKKTSGFGLQVILGGSICVSGPCTFQVSCGTRSSIS